VTCLAREFVPKPRVWAADVQPGFEETRVTRHAARGVIIGFDQRNEFADRKDVVEIPEHEPDSTGSQTLATISRKDPPGYFCIPIRLQARFTAADQHSSIREQSINANSPPLPTTRFHEARSLWRTSS